MTNSLKKTVTVHAPATIANLVAGFDVMGLTLEHVSDILELTLLEGEERITIKHLDGYGIPENPEENVCGVALKAIQSSWRTQIGFELKVIKMFQPGSGLGSSAASAAGVVVAANELLGKPFSQDQLLDFALEGEALASGSRHADNLAPCLYGGLTLVRDIDPIDIISVTPPPLFVAVIHPHIVVKTSEARKILPQEVPLKTAIRQWANVAGLMTGFLTNDQSLIARSMKDYIVEPVRSKLIPGYDEVKTKAVSAGALGGGIAGSGPSLFMLCSTKEIAEVVAQEMASVYQDLNIGHDVFVSAINNEGIKIKSLSFK